MESTTPQHARLKYAQCHIILGGLGPQLGIERAMGPFAANFLISQHRYQFSFVRRDDGQNVVLVKLNENLTKHLSPTRPYILVNFPSKDRFAE